MLRSGVMVVIMDMGVVCCLSIVEWGLMGYDDDI